jgi:hypothetical protein
MSVSIVPFAIDQAHQSYFAMVNVQSMLLQTDLVDKPVRM